MRDLVYHLPSRKESDLEVEEVSRTIESLGSSVVQGGGVPYRHRPHKQRGVEGHHHLKI